jgi:predicted O-methyltransferase YrrM
MPIGLENDGEEGKSQAPAGSELQGLRIEIVDGFSMPGFQGRYFMWPEEYWLLSKYVDLTNGAYLEIGSMCGIIAMSFAERYPHRRFVCVDKFSTGSATAAGEKEMFTKNLQEHGFTNVSLIEGDSLAVVPTLSENFDLILVDANHAFDYVLGDALNSWRLLSPGGFIAFHDYGYVGETTNAVDEFLRQSAGVFVESASSLAVVQKSGGRQDDSSRPLRAGLRNHMLNPLRTVELELNAAKRELGAAEAEVHRLRQVEAEWHAVQNSTAWRMFGRLRRFRRQLS